MNLATPHNLKSFATVRPQASRADLASRPLRPTQPGVAGRYAAEPKSQHDQMVEKTRTWVAQTFFGTLLKQMRDSPFKSELFGGGRGEQAFGSIYDTHLAQRMAQGLGERIARPIVKKFQRQAAAAYEKNSKQTLTQKEQYRAND